MSEQWKSSGITSIPFSEASARITGAALRLFIRDAETVPGRYEHWAHRVGYRTLDEMIAAATELLAYLAERFPIINAEQEPQP